jgi:hypothetical protein
VLVSFLSLGQIPERNNLRQERFVLAHGFRSFSPRSGPIGFGPVARLNIMEERHGEGKLLTSWQMESREEHACLCGLLPFPPLTPCGPLVYIYGWLRPHPGQVFPLS